MTIFKRRTEKERPVKGFLTAIQCITQFLSNPALQECLSGVASQTQKIIEKAPEVDMRTSVDSEES